MCDARHTVNSGESAQELMKHLQYPVVVQPCSDWAGKKPCKVFDDHSYMVCVQECMDSSTNGIAIITEAHEEALSV